MQTNRNLVLYIAMSLDGFIATPEGDLAFLGMVEKEGEDYGYHAFVKTVDTIIVGRKTWDKVFSMIHTNPHPDKTVYVITRTVQASEGNVHYYTGSLRELVQRLKNEPGKNIYCDGGAEIVNLLLNDGLIDELVVSVIPVLLGKGIALFNNSRPEMQLQLVQSTAFEKGLVQLHYKRR